MRVAIASDHGGWALKGRLLEVMAGLPGIEVIDLGTDGPESVDYPDYALPVADGVASGRFDRGILICGTGVGMAIAANKVRGVRAALCSDPLTARLSREHNDANVLALGGRIIGPEMAAEIVRVWLTTPFAGDRHSRRLAKIAAREAVTGAGEGGQ